MDGDDDDDDEVLVVVVVLDWMFVGVKTGWVNICLAFELVASGVNADTPLETRRRSVVEELKFSIV